MSEEPALPPVDDKDWTWVLERPCPDCGYDAQHIEPTDVPAIVRDAVDDLIDALGRPNAAVRPSPEVWSPLEYACHVRDVLRVFGARLSLMRAADDPLFANWDQDATARDERYWLQDPATVAAELRVEGERLATDFESVRPQEWSRPGRRSNGATFTIETLGRYFVHDLIHHVHDVGA